jgi:hypothetical protein
LPLIEADPVYTETEHADLRQLRPVSANQEMPVKQGPETDEIGQDVA